MRIFENQEVLTFKEASERFTVPVTWLRKQLGKPVLPEGGVLRVVKFPADKNYYLFLSEVEQISKPRVYSTDYIRLTQEAYDRDPEKDPEDRDERL